MQLNYINKPHFDNGAIEKISEVLKAHGIKNPLICTDPGLSSCLLYTSPSPRDGW